jgi:hypothetical protein
MKDMLVGISRRSYPQGLRGFASLLSTLDSPKWHNDGGRIRDHSFRFLLQNFYAKGWRRIS